MRAFALALPVLLLAASCTTDGDDTRSARSGATRGDQCFNANSVSGFNPVGRDAVDVSISRDRVYRLGLSAGCFDVDWAQRVALRSRGGGFICGPSDAELFVPSVSGGRPDRCTVLSVRRLSQDEIGAGRRR